MRPCPGARPRPRPRPACLIGLLLSIIRVASASTEYTHDSYDSYDDTAGLVQKSFDVIAVDVGIVDIVSIQRANKLPITAAPLVPGRKLVFARKASSTCPSSFVQCPSSLSGGCCPTGFACDTSDCVQTSVAPSASATAAAATAELACGRAGYTGCGVADGGGCCPSGYTCGRQHCTPPAGAAASQSCPPAYHLCPSSLNYGCCATSMGCALNGCYATTPTTLVFTATFTTATGTAESHVTTITSTTVHTPTPPTDTAGGRQTGSSTTDALVAKLVPTTTAKASLVAASGGSGSDSGGGGGLSPGAIGGLIGGLVALLLAIAVAAYCIIKNVRRTSRALDEAKRLSGSSDKPKPPPKTKTPGKTPGTGSATKPRASLHRATPEVDGLLAGAPIAVDETSSSSSGIGHSFQHRHRTAASTPAQLSADAAASSSSSSGYFDIPQQRTHNRPGRYSQGSDPRISADSPPPAVLDGQGGRRPRVVSHASSASNTDGALSPPLTGAHTPGVGSPHQPAELGVDGAFIPELPVAPSASSAASRPRPFSNISAVSGLSYAGFGPSLPQQQQQQQQQQQPLMTDYGHQRTWSDSSTSPTGANAPLYAPPPQPQPSASAPQPQLDVVVEERLHGHYGPDHEVAGQTRPT